MWLKIYYVNPLIKQETSMDSTKVSYTVKTMQQEHAKPVIDLFIKTFCTSEPITRHLDIDKEEYRPFATAVVEKAIQEGLSTVALNEKNKIIAFIIVEDMAEPFVPELNRYPNLQPIFDLLTELSRPFVDGKKYIKGKVAHFWLAGVEKAYMGHGMFTDLDNVTIQMAAEKGFNFAYAEFTNEVSEKVTRQFKVIELCNRVSYEDFTMENGQKPFKGVRGGAAAYCAAIIPGVKLDSLQKCYTMDA
jgi:hypothetical protein